MNVVKKEPKRTRKTRKTRDRSGNSQVNSLRSSGSNSTGRAGGASNFGTKVRDALLGLFTDRLGSSKLMLFGAIVSGVVGITGFCLWPVNHSYPGYISSYLVNMKPITALCFVLMSASVVCIKYKKLTLIATFALSVLLLMLGTIAVAVLGDSAMRSSLLTERMSLTNSDLIGIPALGTVAAFTLSACGLVVWLVGNGPLRPVRRAMSLMTIVLGVAAILGYVTGLDFLFWSLPNTSSAMAIHTALGFIGLGLAVHEVEMSRELKLLHR